MHDSPSHTPPRTGALLALPLGLFAALLFAPALGNGLWEPGEAALALALDALHQAGEHPFASLSEQHPHALRLAPLALLASFASLPLLDGIGLRLPGLLAVLAAVIAAFLVLRQVFGDLRALLAALLVAASPAAILGATSASAGGLALGLQALALLALLAACSPQAGLPSRLLAGTLAPLAILASGATGALIVLGTPALLALTWPREGPAESATQPARILGAALLVFGVLAPATLVWLGGWENTRNLAALTGCVVAPAGALLLAARRSPLAFLARPAGLAWWIPLIALLAAASFWIVDVAGVDALIRSLSARDLLVGSTIDGHLHFDHTLRWAAYAIFPTCVLVPAAFAWLADRPPAGTAAHEHVLRRALLLWAAAAFFVHAFAGSLAREFVPPLAVPVIAAAVLAITDPSWLHALRERAPAVRNALGLTALLLLAMTSRDVRGTQDLELGRPGPHVIFEAALLDGVVDFPESYTFALIRLFLVGWAALIALLFLSPAIPALQRLLARLAGRRPAHLLPAAALCIAIASWGVEISVRDFPSMSEHFSTQTLARTAQELGGEGPLAVLALDERARGWHLRDPDIASFDAAEDLRLWLCSADPEGERPLAIVRGENWSRIWSTLRRTPPRRQLPEDAPEACRDPVDVAVVAAPGERFLLIAARPEPGDDDLNPLREWIVDEEDIPEDAVRPEERVVAGGGLRLVASRIAPASLRSGEVTVETWWEVERMVVGEWEVFIHAETRGGRLVGDHPPVQGLYPVRDWVPGEIVHDRATLELGPGSRRGTWRVYTGFFRGETRMGIRPAAEDDRLLLGTFEAE